jgi:parallel beta-helix repeat protein
MRSQSLIANLFLCLLTLLIFSARTSAQALSVSPTSITLQADVGASLPSQIVNISDNGNGALKWSISTPTASWLSVSPTSGVQPGKVTVSFASTLAAGTYSASFAVSTNQSAVTVDVQVTINPLASTPPPDGTSSGWTFCANEGGYCTFSGTQQVRYGANGVYVYKTLTDGTTCTNSVFGDPIYGAAKQCYVGGSATVAPSGSWNFCANEGGYCGFSGTLQVRYGANEVYVYKTLTGGTACTNSVFGDPAYGVAKHCDVAGTATTSSSSSTASTGTGVGPQGTITCPSGAVSIWPGTLIQNMVNQYAAGTTFCIRAGVHYLSGSITPKTGNTFVGEYGAILDGTGWSTTDASQAAFRAHNEDIDDVTIRNLVIRNMPQRGIHAYYWASDRWTIEYNEIASNQHGVAAPNNSLVRNNYIHHNAVGGYSVFRAANTVFDGNDISYNGKQKVLAASNITFRNNFVHNNLEDGIWYDGDSVGGVVEGNTSEGNNGEGIFIEISSQIIIRNNTLRRNVSSGIFISSSKNIEAYNTTLEDNFAGIQYYLNCDAVGGGSTGWDLTNNSVHDNVIKVGTLSGSVGDAL